jgi:peptidoglycan/xylan/chitin deacetylase (PgdA/CDA1 family)
MHKGITMKNKTGAILGNLFSIGCLILIAAFIGGCATATVKPTPVIPPQVEAPPVTVPKVVARMFPDFVAVIAQEKDSLSSLASKYLNVPSMDWFIAEFNGISSLSPGQVIIIPLKPYERGGMNTKGYQTVPVLSYHNFSRSGFNKSTVTQAAFEEQMELLKNKGYRIITMDQLFDFLDFKSQIPKKSVVITIDDGWRSAYEIALPILKKYGYPATLFVYTDLIVGSEKTLSWDLIQEMVENGIDVQCHTKTHRKLTVMENKESFKEYFEAIDKELTESARIIKKRLNRDVKYFAYPYGETNHLIIELLKKHGYRGAFTVKRGGNPFFIDNYKVNRSMVYGEFDLKQFENNLAVFNEEEVK